MYGQMSADKTGVYSAGFPLSSGIYRLPVGTNIAIFKSAGT